MKNKLSLLSIACVALFTLSLASCQKEDDIRPIYAEPEPVVDPEVDPEVESNYCCINGDTIPINQVTKYRNNRSSDNTDEWYNFSATSKCHVELYNIRVPHTSNDTLYTSQSDGHVSVFHNMGHYFYLDQFTVSVSRQERVHKIHLHGTSSQGDTVSLHFCDTLIDLNEYTGNGSLTIADGSHPLYQLARRTSDTDQEYVFTLCDPTDSNTFAQSRIEIRCNGASGSFQLSDSSNISVAILTGYIHSWSHTLTRHPITSGNILFSNNNGRYSMECTGTCDLGPIHFSFDGHGLNTDNFPFTLEDLW